MSALSVCICKVNEYCEICLDEFDRINNSDRWTFETLTKNSEDPRSDKEFASDAQKTLDDLTFFSPCNCLDGISMNAVKEYKEMGYKLKGSQNTGVALESCAWNEGDFTKADIIQIYPVDQIIWFVYL